MSQLSLGSDKDNVVDRVLTNMSHSTQSSSTTKTSQTIQELLKQGLLYQSRNKLQDAIGVYDNILLLEENNVEALTNKGICLKLLGKSKEASACIWKALSLSNTDPSVLNAAATLYREAQKFHEAIRLYKQALLYDPHFTPAKENLCVTLTDLGTHLKVQGHYKEGLSKYHEALTYDPKYAPAYYNIGVVYSELQQYQEALSNYSKAIELNPYYCEAYCNIGVIYKNMDRLEEAISYYEKAVSINPNFDIAKHNLAIAYTDLGTKVKNEGRLNESIKLYKRALYFNSKYADAYYNLGVAYGEKGQFEKATLFYELAIHFNPLCAVAYNNLGVIYKNRDNLQRAIECYQMALKINPKFSQTLNNLGVVYTMQGKLEEAYASIKAAIKENPQYVEAYNNLGVLYRDECEIEEAIACYDKCLAMQPLSRNAGQNRLLAMNYLENISVDEVFRAHVEWAERFEAQYEPYTQFPNVPDSYRKLRIGYISPDFFVHSVSYFIEALLAHYNPQAFHITCYSNVVKPDYKTERLRAYVNCWRPIFGMDTKAVASMIREDQIDILVELTGHTAGNRLDVVAMRPAPIQITYIGYPNTTGMKRVDYRFTDELVDPLDTPQKFTETLIRIPRCFLCYTPAPDVPEVSPLPCLKNGFITFGSFNNLAKINTKVCEVWATILKSVPHSRLLVKCKPFVSEKVRRKFWDIFERYGVSSTRIDLMGLLPIHKDHLSAYGLIDLSLDTWPYAGTTTTCEALYMGVPVVTLRNTSPTGCSHAHNVGVSLLTQIGHQRFIANSIEEYIKIAVDLANDVPQLREIRRTLRTTMLNSPLCDGAGHTRNVEEIYRHLWIRWCEKQKKLHSESDPNTHSSTPQ